MKQIIKKIMIGAIGIASISAFAQSTQSSLQVQANVQKGCVFSAEDINFGVLDTKDSSARNAVANISLQCSKGTVLNLTTNSSSYSGTPIYLNGTVNSEEGKYFNYLVLPFTGSITGATLSQEHSEHGINNSANSVHSSTITMQTPDLVKIPLIGRIQAGQITTALVPGEYSTSLTYNISY